MPPYLAEDVKDSGLALHLARFGDVEAARKLVDPADTDALRRIEEMAGFKNYPVEWTRLVALLLHNAQLQLVTEEQFKSTRAGVLAQAGGGGSRSAGKSQPPGWGHLLPRAATPF